MAGGDKNSCCGGLAQDRRYQGNRQGRVGLHRAEGMDLGDIRKGYGEEGSSFSCDLGV